MAIVIDGKALAAKVKANVAEEAKSLTRQPGLAVILVGNNPASRTYVTSKEKDCQECGFLSFEYKLEEDTQEKELLDLIAQLNEDPKVDGILVQMPLPRQLDEQKVINAISPEKDVDGFHPVNVGRLVIGEPTFLPCTPAGVMEMFKEYEIPIRGKHCVVLGRSNIVGKPMSSLLLQQDGTVTTCHSKTPNMAEITRQADILVSAVGKRNLVTADMVKEGAVVIDVAMNRNDEGKLCGDVDYPEVAKKASYITPVPGGVGPMTRAILMKNILTAAKMHQGV
jgi:methylenetetrahydrofolate dehydrogenase (NADP+)/methenyltetrahydrofolate cyclohydrolase